MKLLRSFGYPQDIKILFMDFDGVFTDNKVLVDEMGVEYVTCSRYDGFGISYLQSINMHLAVLTTEQKQLASLRCKKLKLACFDSLLDKLDFASAYLKELEIPFENSAFIGNDVNDWSLLQAVRFPIVTPDSHPSVQNRSFYTTSKPGGQGCIRELADFFKSTIMLPSSKC